MGRGEKVRLFFSSIGHQAYEPSIGHQVGIFFYLLPSPFIEGELGSLQVFFSKHNFQLSFNNICSYNLLRQNKNDYF
jgi:hypothetical protein